MSPFVVRRYRAERLLRDEFEGLREGVIGGVSRRLRAAGVRLDAGDLDACYAQAWQGLYAAVLDGGQIDDPTAWLAVVTYRRAIDEHRSRRATALRSFDGERELGTTPAGVVAAQEAGGRDIAAELDDRARLRQLFEALRARLSERERQAATLCYLQGLSRADAAARMGVSESRMRKLMEGRGTGSPGVAAKMGALVRTIGDGEWCEEQGSPMRGLAYGILDPRGERYRLAQLHRDACPACRAYVLSLRGLAAVLPPAPVLLHWALGAGAGAGAAGVAGAAAGGATGTGTGATGATGVGGTVGSGGASAAGAGAGAGGGSAGSGLAAGALSASGAAGVGAAGGSWWLAGPLGAKLAVGCLLALGVGAGCVAIGGGAGGAHAPAHRHRAARETHAARARAYDASALVQQPAQEQRPRAPVGQTATATPARIAGARQASREFGPEQAAASGGSATASGASRRATATASSAGRTAAAGGQGATAAPVPAASATVGAATAGSAPAAEREFSPG